MPCPEQPLNSPAEVRRCGGGAKIGAVEVCRCAGEAKTGGMEVRRCAAEPLCSLPGWEPATVTKPDGSLHYGAAEYRSAVMEPVLASPEYRNAGMEPIFAAPEYRSGGAGELRGCSGLLLAGG